ncbi:MAG: ribosome maturation factor RimM [Rickettsiales bacterium]|nr:ribosome maturation factor RimM [Rickettsiales bacterium]
MGKILSTHGLDGNVKLLSFCSNPEDIFNYNLFDGKGNEMKCHRVGSTSKRDIFLAKFEDINSMDEAKKYKNSELFVEKGSLEPTETDEVYVNDLIGMRVDDGKRFGTIENFYNYGASDTIEVLWDNGKSESIPFQKPFIREVNEETKTIFIDSPTYI